MGTAATLLLLFPLTAVGSPPSPAIEGLAQAAEAYRAGQYERCAELAAPLAGTELLNQDVALLLAGQCSFHAGDFETARERFEQLAERHPESPHAELARLRAADCRWELGQHVAAARAYQQAPQHQADPRVDPAVGLMRRALVALQAGQTDQGHRLWIELRSRFPEHPLATAAPPGHPEPALDFAQSMTVARGLNRARQWEQALAMLDSTPDPANAREQFELAQLTGRVLFDMRFRYPQAARLLIAARDHAPTPELAQETWFYASRALGRADRDAEAVASHLAMVAAHPGGRPAAEALFYAGWLEQNQGRCDRALPILERVGREYPKERWAREARWFCAWCHLRQHDWLQAIEALGPQLTWHGWEAGGRARYWTGVAQLRLGQQVEAQATFARVCAEYPLTWYERLARLRLGDQAPALPTRPKAAEPLAPLTDPLLERAHELAAAGLGELASLLLRQQEKRFLARHPGRQGLWVLLDAYRATGDFHRPWYLSLVRERRALEELPDEQTLALWQHAYPPCERSRLGQWAGSDAPFVLMLQAIMRTESGFAPQALSVANARGLMQMIPPTAVRVAAELGLAGYSDDALFDPEVNIQTAAHYIGGLVARFKRQWPVAAAAYNAGPQSVAKWCQEQGDLELDAFVESIPYTETRNYAKRVLTAMSRYAWLEAAGLPELRLQLDPQVADQGPDY